MTAESQVFEASEDGDLSLQPLSIQMASLPKPASGKGVFTSTGHFIIWILLKIGNKLT